MLKCCMIIQQIVKDFITLHQVLAEKCNLKSLYIHAVMVQSVGAFDMHLEGLVFKTEPRQTSMQVVAKLLATGASFTRPQK